MKNYEIYQGNTLYSNQIQIADTFLSRFRGLMLRPSLAPGQGLLLQNCPAIHCCFMRFPIDAVYLDDSMTVLGTETVHPWHLGGHFAGARHVLEVEAGKSHSLKTGMHLTIKECDKP